MKSNNFILVTKDAMCTDYLPCYGNKQWHTPNIDALVEKGTLFTNYYCAAPSSTMAMYSMVTGVFAHETKYEIYQKIHDVYVGETAFTRLKELGYECHLIWDEMWNPTPDYFDCYRNDVIIHSLHNFRQGVGAHYRHDGFLKDDDNKATESYNLIEKTISEIIKSEKKVFIWIHYPHVIYGKTSYGGDIELFDKHIGMIRQYFCDDRIAISADHGNMNGHKNKLCYGFDVYQPNSRIPLITPRIGNYKQYTGNVSACDIFTLIFGKIVTREFVYCDTQYRSQPKRRLAIIYNNYKYIYNKDTKRQELYDLKFDPNEEFNLFTDYTFDADRKVNVPSRELYYYPYWDELPEIRQRMLNEKKRIWKNGLIRYEFKVLIKELIKPIYIKIHAKKNK